MIGFSEFVDEQQYPIVGRWKHSDEDAGVLVDVTISDNGTLKVHAHDPDDGEVF